MLTHSSRRYLSVCRAFFTARVLTLRILVIVGVSLPAAYAKEPVTRSSAQPGFVLVEKGRNVAAIIVSEADSPEKSDRPDSEYLRTPAEFRGEIRRAAEELADYVEKISGARPEVMDEVPEVMPAAVIWVGYHPKLKELFPEIDFDFKHPEEIVIAANEKHLVIAGRDRGPEEAETVHSFDHIRRDDVAMPMLEYGTANAVATFLQKHLEVRWLWPGELGEDIVKKDTIRFAPFVYRHQPPIIGRRFSLEPAYYRGAESREVFRWWEDHQRNNRRSSFRSPLNHSFNEWWDRYHEEHPDYFALQPNGTRTPPGAGKNVKLCVSNPAVAEQWLKELEQEIREHPNLKLVGATPTDSGGWCVCEQCRAWDHPDAPKGVLTERYVKFWNSLARGMKERFPGRDLQLDVLAYAVYKTPPIETRLEDNIAIRYVGHYPFATDSEWEVTRAEMRKWKEAGADAIGYRPNMFWYDGGFWGMPSNELAKTVKLFKFLAEIDANALEVDSIRMHPATQAPQLYLMAQLVYDPARDGQAVIQDFFRRGFGPAAEGVRDYFTVVEEAHSKLMNLPEWRISSGARREHVQLLHQVYTPELLGRAQDALSRAKEAVSGGDQVYQKRVEFVQTGLDFVSVQMEIVPLMERVRRSEGRDREAVQEAEKLSDRRDALLEAAPPFAMANRHFQEQVLRGWSKLQDHLGPPSQEYLDAAAPEASAAGKLAVAHYWKEELRDDFQRDELGPDWEVRSGEWKVKEGHLESTGRGNDNLLISTKRFAGLQRIEFEAVAIPAEKGAKGAEGEVSDLSAFIHADGKDPRSGYGFQFGGRFNKVHSLSRNGQVLVKKNATPNSRIVPGRSHSMVVEFDGQHIRLKVDGQVVLEHEEKDPLLGKDHEAVGFYSYTPMKISSVRVFTAEPREAEFFDDPDTN